MGLTIYIETTIISYLTARPSRELIIAAHQLGKTADRIRFVHLASCQRASVLEGIPLLSVSGEAVALAKKLVEKGPIPKKAEVDALHIAVAAANGMEYLLTWNCKHMANAEMQVGIERLCPAAGYEPPVICTPEELLGSS